MKGNAMAFEVRRCPYSRIANATDATRYQRRIGQSTDTDRDVDTVFDQVGMPFRDVEVDRDLRL
jgi:hypothetical protein